MHILLTGEPRAGKTTVLNTALAIAKTELRGFVTEEIRRNEQRVGFLMRVFGARSVHVIAYKAAFAEGLPMLGDYQVDVSNVLKIACPLIERAVADNERLVIDEIGQMQLMAGERFETAVRCAFDRTTQTIATIQARSHPFSDELKARGDVRIFTVTPDNHQPIIRDIVAEMLYPTA